MKCTRWLSPVFLLLLVAVSPAIAENVATIPAPTGYIDDYAGVISAPAKSDMEDLARELHDKTKAQVFLVTIKTLEGEPVETFANELFAKWKIGEKKTDRGVLMLFAIKDHKRWIEIGYGLEGILNDAKVGDIGREMVPDLKAARYDEATKIGLQEISQVIATDSGVTLDALASNAQPETAPAPVTDPPASSASLSGASWVFFLFPFAFILIFVFIIWRIVSAVRRGTLTHGGSGYDGGSTFGGSDNLGSSSSDSGGDSFGGGDGGTSGGGGAGGDW
jgi:uncharacterized protein